ncbi:MAG: phosphopantetheine-binding protein [Candidatus Omnitrophota bacterium]
MKIRGYRIELGELENALMRFESIKDAAVTVHEDARGEPHLVAYLVPHSTKDKETIDEVREFLHTQLPAYMIPSFFVLLENLPLTPNGKLDRKALPNPEFPRGTYVAPTNDIEEKIVGIWKDILKLDPIGVHDSFFKIGGTSLNIIQVNTRLKEVFNLDIPMPAMFEYPTIRTLSQYIKTLSPGGNSRNSPREDVKPMNKPAPTGKNKLKDRKKIMTGESHV